MEPTDKYKHCNHHHEIGEEQELVNIGGCEFVADKKLIPLLTELNRLGLQTRTHNYHKEGSFIGLIMDERQHFEIRHVSERDSSRTEFNGKVELLIAWKPK